MSVRHALLGLLAQRPRHGYDLHTAFEAMVGGEQNWDVKPAQVYSTLARLEQAGYVAQEAVQQEAGPEKHIFAITSAGRHELALWFQAGVPPEHQRDEFYLKLMLGLATGEASPRRLVQLQRSWLFRALHALTAARAKLNPQTALAQILLHDKGIMHLEADLRWLDMIEARLEDVQRQPLPEPEPRPR
ncbi:MAG: helix-turn-helix transcriptional regulator, partial [Anaerolineales bacterium]